MWDKRGGFEQNASFAQIWTGVGLPWVPKKHLFLFLIDSLFPLNPISNDTFAEGGKSLDI